MLQIVSDFAFIFCWCNNGAIRSFKVWGNMIKKFLFVIVLFSCCMPVLSIIPEPLTTKDDFAGMTKLWCTVDYKLWPTSYSNQVGYSEVDFYLYLDEPNKKIYDQYRHEMAQILDFNDKEIKFVNKYHQDKRTITENYTLNRYTGRAKGEGTIRHDYGGWASITYENKNFNAKGQCASVSEEKKF